MQTSTANTATAANITLEKVAADYKLQSQAESFLIQGRKHAQFPMRPYYHVVLRAPANSLPALPALPGTTALLQTALAKLWNIATLELLKDKAAGMDAGSKITATLTADDVIKFINDMGNRERTAISGEELDEFTASYAFQALAQVHNWTAVQVAKVSTALRQYAAPAHKKQQQDAGILLKRLEALPSLLLGDDAALDADLLKVYQWLAAKLQRDVNAVEMNLADSI